MASTLEGAIYIFEDILSLATHPCLTCQGIRSTVNIFTSKWLSNKNLSSISLQLACWYHNDSWHATCCDFHSFTLRLTRS